LVTKVKIPGNLGIFHIIGFLKKGAGESCLAHKKISYRVQHAMLLRCFRKIENEK